MKQHITDHQWNELSDEAKFKIRKWYNNPIIDKWKLSTNLSLSIGQLIEFLMDNTNGKSIDLENHVEGVRGYVSRVAFGRVKSPVLVAWNKKELVDALWEAVKEVVEK